MPDLASDFHLGMLQVGHRVLPDSKLYGLNWGDPDTFPPLMFFRDHYIRPYLDPAKTALEIGPGGGRWTQYLLSFNRVIAVDYHQELLDELTKGLRSPSLVPVRNDGLTLPGVPDGSVDYVLSFGVFVHLEEYIRDSYLTEIRRVLAPDGVAVIQYGEKLKRRAADNEGFAANSAAPMRAKIVENGFYILEENLTLLDHSNVIVFRHVRPDEQQWLPDYGEAPTSL